MFKNRTILICSPQNWGQLHISKHHYAIELARRGNKVFFLSPPKRKISRSISLARLELNEKNLDLTLINFAVLIPYQIRFHWKSLFDWMIKFQISRIRNKIGVPLDIVWDFDNSCTFSNLLWFEANINIYHPVDRSYTYCPNKNEHFVFSVADDILEAVETQSPKHLINHGLSPLYKDVALSTANSTDNRKLKVGYVGNLLFPNLDYDTMMLIIGENPEIEFHIIGPYENNKDNNIGNPYDPDSRVNKFVEFVKKQKNVILYGLQPPTEVTKLIKRMDAFLVCYLNNEKVSHNNTHKILEYLASGKVIFSSYLSAYKKTDPSLILFADYGSNEKLPILLQKIQANLEYFNSTDLQGRRKALSLEHTYEKQVDRIERIIYATER